MKQHFFFSKVGLKCKQLRFPWTRTFNIWLGLGQLKGGRGGKSAPFSRGKWSYLNKWFPPSPFIGILFWGGVGGGALLQHSLRHPHSLLQDQANKWLLNDFVFRWLNYLVSSYPLYKRNEITSFLGIHSVYNIK
jgi:hypothetical protein